MTHVFISPHLDDIALSCGGFAFRLTGAGQRVVVVTLMTGDAPPLDEQSETARRVGAVWQLGPNPFEGRRKEDLAACAVMRAEPQHLGLLDAIYRRDDAGRALYVQHFIGAATHPYDEAHFTPQLEAVLRGVFARMGDDALTVYAPLAIGGHVDHQLVRRAVENVAPSDQLRFYEDFPYADWGADRLNPKFAIAEQTVGLRAERYALSDVELDARIRAVDCYASQLTALFGKAADMPARVRDYVGRVGGERFWHRV